MSLGWIRWYLIQKILEFKVKENLNLSKKCLKDESSQLFVVIYYGETIS
jgi:hypothetical protein